MRGAVAGLLTIMIGCQLFIPAIQTATYGVFLFALFVLAGDVVIVQVVSNPFMPLLGKPQMAHRIGAAASAPAKSIGNLHKALQSIYLHEKYCSLSVEYAHLAPFKIFCTRYNHDPFP